MLVNSASCGQNWQLTSDRCYWVERSQKTPSAARRCKFAPAGGCPRSLSVVLDKQARPVAGFRASACLRGAEIASLVGDRTDALTP
jgi:hypothetical protein